MSVNRFAYVHTVDFETIAVKGYEIRLMTLALFEVIILLLLKAMMMISIV
mgnify:CR=1 FL=1